MSEVLVNVCAACYAIALCVSFLFCDRLLKMESHLPLQQRHQGGRAVGIFSVALSMGRCYPRWEDIKAMVIGVRLYVAWLFRTPAWVTESRNAQRAIWIMRSSFWFGALVTVTAKYILL